MIIRMRSLTGALVYGGVALGLLWAILPTVVLFLLSFTAGPVSSFPPQELTLSSYRELLGSEELRRVLLNSLTVSAIATGVALIVGVPAGLALYRHRVPFARSLNVFFGLSFVVPVVVSGLGFLILFQRIGLVGNLPSIGVAVAIINLPFMLWAVAAAVGGMNPELDQAAATLGAEGVERFLFVTLPGIAPGILVGSLLVFVFAVTDFLLSLLLVTANTTTLPVFIYGGLRLGISPRLAVVSVLYVVIAIICFALAMRKRRLERFLERKPL